MFQRYSKSGILLILVCLVVFSETSETKKAVDLVKKAAEFMNTYGSERGKEELQKSNGQFCKGNIYVFAYDTTGIMIAHPKNHKLIGVNLIDVPDADGKLFRKEIIMLAKSKGNGWVDYKYKNPAKREIESKTAYVQKYGNLVLCCGIYKQ